MWVRCGLAVRQVDNMARPRLLVDVTGLAFRPPHKALRQVLNRLLGLQIDLAPSYAIAARDARLNDLAGLERATSFSSQHSWVTPPSNRCVPLGSATTRALPSSRLHRQWLARMSDSTNSTNPTTMPFRRGLINCVELADGQSSMSCFEATVALICFQATTLALATPYNGGLDAGNH